MRLVRLESGLRQKNVPSAPIGSVPNRHRSVRTLFMKSEANGLLIAFPCKTAVTFGCLFASWLETSRLSLNVQTQALPVFRTSTNPATPLPTPAASVLRHSGFEVFELKAYRVERSWLKGHGFDIILYRLRRPTRVFSAMVVQSRAARARARAHAPPHPRLQRHCGSLSKQQKINSPQTSACAARHARSPLK